MRTARGGFILCLTLSACVLEISAVRAQTREPRPMMEKEREASGRLISMDFRNAEIGDVLRLLAKQHNLNLILAEGVQGPISVRFSNVGIEEALDAIITVNGFTYTRRGQVIRVTVPGTE